jgi:tRNA (cytidine/uridine-2'-O-)-methyltransferase
MPDLHVVLVEPEIHWNTGNAGRTCLAVGAQLHLVQPLGFSLDEAQVRRAGLDYWPRVAPRVWPGWDELERALPELGEPFFFSSSWSGARPFQEVRYPRPAVLVFGRESVGLPTELLARNDGRTVRIPMLDPALRSLNLSTSVGVAAYEVLRQWR